MAGDESDFYHRAGALIEQLYEALEAQDSEGLLDLEPQDGLLSIAPEKGGRPWIISRHVAAGEIWLSSPVSGGLHFRDAGNQWLLPDGRELVALLQKELSEHCGSSYRF